MNQDINAADGATSAAINLAEYYYSATEDPQRAIRYLIDAVRHLRHLTAIQQREIAELRARLKETK